MAIMPAKRGLEAKLASLKALRNQPASPDHVPELRKSLADKSNLVAADAAEIIAERLLSELVPDLVAAFDRFMIDPEDSDKLCRGKISVVEALNKLEYEKEEVYRRGIVHVQMEPVWGGTEDTAPPLRANCAFGLVRLNAHGIVLLLTDLLNDREKVARHGAAQALGALSSPAVIPLLRFKALVGDKEPEVTGECLSSLMSIDADASLPFVKRFLDSDDEAVQEGAAFALGETRKPKALAILKDQWNKPRI